MDFVTFEIAKKLKEKGFDYKCIAYYYGGRADVSIASLLPKDHNRSDSLYRKTSAPTIAQVLKWLREEKLILIGLFPIQEYGGDEMVEWCANIYKTDNKSGLSWKKTLYYQSYEAAALAGIEYVLDNLI